MAMTEARPAPETSETTAAPTGAATPTRTRGGVIGMLGTGSDRVIGRLWIGTSLVFLVMTGALGALLGAERLEPGTYDVFSKDSLAQALSLHGISGVFLVAIPLMIGIATVVVPRQVGSASIAFPRAAALAYWTYLVGGALVVVSYLINGGPFGGNDKGVDLFLISLALTVAALCLGLLCIAVTVLALRVPGLYIERTPLFSFSMLVTAVIWLASLGLLFGLLTLLYFDHRYRAFNYANADHIDDWLRWTMGQPQIYAAAIPALGFIGDAVATACRVRAPHVLMRTAIAIFSVLTFGAWSFNAFENSKLQHEFLFIAFAFAIIVPLLMFTAGVADTLMRGHIRVTSPFLFAITTLLLLWGAVLTGAVHVIHRLKLIGTSTDSSIAHWVLGAAVVAAVGAVHYWWPQILRQPLREGLGRLTALILLIGVAALAAADIVTGLLDEPRGSVYTTARDGVKALNGVSFAGGCVVALAVLVFVVNLAMSLARRPDDDLDDVDPWEGQTLEWCDDPHAVTVASDTPLLDRREA